MADGNESNWWPGAPQSNGGPGGYANPRSPGARAGQSPWDQPQQQPQSPQPQSPQPRQPPWGGGSDPGRARDPQRADPQRADPYPEEPRGRHRTDPPGAYAGPAGPGEKRGTGRTMTFVGGGVLVVIVLVAMGLGLSRGGGSAGAASVQVTESAGVSPTVDAAGGGPGTPAVTARSVGGQQVEFSWSYANAASGDTFQVQVSGAGKPTVADKPDLTLSVAQGQKTCVQVQVISASGATSPESSQVCWPS